MLEKLHFLSNFFNRVNKKEAEDADENTTTDLKNKKIYFDNLRFWSFLFFI